LKSHGLPLLTIGVTLATVILLVSAVSNPVDARLSCTNSDDCFVLRFFAVVIAPLSLLIVMLLGGNAFGIRRKQGRTYASAFEATQAHSVTQQVVLKLLVKSACLLAALGAIGASVWISLPLLGDAIFVQMWNVPLNSQVSPIKSAIAALKGYELLALVVVAAIGVVVWVAEFAVLGALWSRYSRRANVAAAALLSSGLALAVLAVAEHKGIVPPSAIDAIFVAARWAAAAAIVGATVYLYRSSLAEGTLTARYALGALLVSMAFVAAWVTLLRAAGVQLAGMPWTSIAPMLLWPLFLPLSASALAPWAYSRIRHL
jgi:hypothetical protein